MSLICGSTKRMLSGYGMKNILAIDAAHPYQLGSMTREGKYYFSVMEDANCNAHIISVGHGPHESIEGWEVTFATSGDALVTDESSMALMLSSSHLCQILQPGAIQVRHQQVREPEKSAGLEAFALLSGSAGRAAYEQRHQACMPAYVLSIAQC